MKVHVYGGNNLFTEKEGMQNIYQGGDVKYSIVGKFNSRFGNMCTEEEKKAIISVLYELVEMSKENPEMVKKTDEKHWGEKIRTALGCVASIVTISKAPWWSPLAEMIKNYISNL